MDQNIYNIKINPPEGYEFDTEKSTIDNIVFKKKVLNGWEKFCKDNPVTSEEYFISGDSSIKTCQIAHSPVIDARNPLEDKNLFKTKEDAEAVLALIQLRRMWHENPDRVHIVNYEQLYFMPKYNKKENTWISYLYGYSDYNPIKFFPFESYQACDKFIKNNNYLFYKLSKL